MEAYSLQQTAFSSRSRLSLIINSAFQRADSDYIKLIQGAYLKRREFERVRIKAALEEFKGGSAIAVVGFAAKLSRYPLQGGAYKAATCLEYVLQ